MIGAWLMLVKKDGRIHAGNLGYDDDESHFYSWDNTVANSMGPKPGHRIVIWDSRTLLGASIIEKITEGKEHKIIRRCPHCNSTDIRERTTKTPKFRCADQNCRLEFDKAKESEKKVKTFRTKHDSAWQDYSGRLGANVLRSICEKPNTQHSIRALKWAEFVKYLEPFERKKLRNTENAVESWRTGGRKQSFTKVRMGQGRFRTDLIAKFGSVCALIGKTPIQALEAAHLYSYSNFEKHLDGGGVLLRRDLHRLFDLGLITVDPGTLKIILDGELQSYDQYHPLHGKYLSIELSSKEKNWFRLHWAEHHS